MALSSTLKIPTICGGYLMAFIIGWIDGYFIREWRCKVNMKSFWKRSIVHWMRQKETNPILWWLYSNFLEFALMQLSSGWPIASDPCNYITYWCLFCLTTLHAINENYEAQYLFCSAYSLNLLRDSILEVLPIAKIHRFTSSSPISHFRLILLKAWLWIFSM